MKKFIWALALCFACANFAQADLIITAVIDTPSGSHPRVLEVQATDNIADTSAFWFVRQTNGTGTITDTQFSSFALNQGDFAYVTTGGDSTTYLNNNSFGPILASVSSWNGDDILGVSFGEQAAADASDSAADLTSDMVDTFGLFGQSDTDFYADSAALRNSSSVAGTGSGLLDASNFTISPLDDVAAAEAFGIANFGTFVAVPEPTTAMIFSLAGLGLCVVRRRS
jgi:hypothetical protein